jgi:hypothetical protein
MKSYIFIALGVLVFGAGAAFAVINHVDTSWPRVSGKVIDTRDMNQTTSPLVEYEASGTKFQVISSDQPLMGSFGSGKSLVVAYNPNSPGEVKIPASGILSAMTWFLIAAGAVLVLIGSIIRKRQQDDDSDDMDPSDSVDEDIHQV